MDGCVVGEMESTRLICEVYSKSPDNFSVDTEKFPALRFPGILHISTEGYHDFNRFNHVAHRLLPPADLQARPA